MCAGDACSGPCRPTVFEGSGGDCAAHVWAWDGSGCAETAHCACTSGECERVFATAVECLTANDECMGPDPVPDPSCAPTTFETTVGACVEDSYVWNGAECESVRHCGCGAGECNRIYDDYQSCEIAHAACLPAGCAFQDARNGGLMCGTLFGYVFNGWMCEEVLCNCAGEDCDAVEDVSLEECEATWALCLDRAPACVPERFPVESTDIGINPTYPPFSFSVEGYADLYDEQTETVAVFADWTAAVWGGWQDVPFESEFCAPITGAFLPSFASCPSPKQLVLDVGGQTFRINVTAHWPAATDLAAPTNVDVRIVAHPSGTLVLEVRDAATDLPVFMVVQTLPGAASIEAPWEFAPLTFAEGDDLCLTAPGACGWSFTPRAMVVSAAGIEDKIVEPLYYRSVEAGGVTYYVFHWAFLHRVDQSEHACSSPYTPLRNFVVFAKAPTAAAP